MANNDNELGFSAKVELRQAFGAFDQLERRVQSVEDTLNGIRPAQIPLIDERGLDKSVEAVNAGFRMLEAMSRQAASTIDKTWQVLASSTEARADAMARAITDSLGRVNQAISETARLMDAIDRQASSRVGAPPSAGRAIAGARSVSGPTFSSPLPGSHSAAIRFSQSTPRAGASVPLPGFGAPLYGARAGASPTAFGPIGTGMRPLAGAGPVPTSLRPSAPSSNIHQLHVQQMTVQHMNTPPGSGGNGGGGGGNGGRPGFGGSVGRILGGVAGMIGLGGIIAYVTEAVRDQAEQIVQTANMATRMSGARGAGMFGAAIRAQGAPEQFTRAESMQMASMLTGSRGSAFAGGTNIRDIGQGLLFTRALGLEVGEAGAPLGRMENAGAFRAGDAGRFTRELAASISQSNMMPRAAEAMEAAAEVLGDVSGRIGDLTDSQRRGYLAVQAQLAQGSEMFRGSRGAAILNGMSDSIAHGGSDQANMLFNMALERAGGGKMSVWQLLARREQGASLGNMQAIGGFLRHSTGGNADQEKWLFHVMFGSLGYKQIDQIFKLTGGFKNFGNAKAITAAAGGRVYSAALAKQASAHGIRQVVYEADQTKNAVGAALIGPFKALQNAILGTANVLAQKAMPMLQRAFGDMAKGDWGGLFKEISGGFSGVIKMLEDQVAKVVPQVLHNMITAKAAQLRAAGNGYEANMLMGLDPMSPTAQKAAAAPTVQQQMRQMGYTGSGNSFRDLVNNMAGGTWSLLKWGAGAASNMMERHAMTGVADRFIGQTYVRGGGHAGFGGKPIPVDCSGLTSQIAYAMSMPWLAGTADQQARMGREVGLKNLRNGDWVYHLQRGMEQGATGMDKQGFGLINGHRFAGHIGVYENGQVVEASSRAGKVVRVPFSSGYWDGARDVTHTAPTAVVQAKIENHYNVQAGDNTHKMYEAAKRGTKDAISSVAKRHIAQHT